MALYLTSHLSLFRRGREVILVNLLLISEPDANNEPEHIIAICYTEKSLRIKHFMKYKTYLSNQYFIM